MSSAAAEAGGAATGAGAGGSAKRPIRIQDGGDESSSSAADNNNPKNNSSNSNSNNKRHKKDTKPVIPAPIKLFATSSDVKARQGTAKDHWSRTQCWTLREMLEIGDYRNSNSSNSNTGHNNSNNNNNNSDNDSSSSSTHALNQQPPGQGPIDFLFIANYLINFEFLLDEIPELLSLPRAVVIYGSKETSEEAWRQACTTLDGSCSVDFVRCNPSDPPNSPSNPLSIKIPYGVHHSKIFLVGYANTGSLRVIIHTANLRYSDIHHKAQAAYIQDFPRKTSSSPSTSPFEEDLVSYMKTYHLHKQYRWDDSYNDTNASSTSTSSSNMPTTLADQIRKYDFSMASVILIPSTPGYHNMSTTSNTPQGHLKLRKAISDIVVPTLAANPDDDDSDTDEDERYKNVGPVVCQFSSIGSLTKKYLHKLEASLDVRKVATQHTNPVDGIDETQPLNLQLVYPTSDEICNSIEGYRGGSSVPGTHKNVSRDFLQPLFRKWGTPQSFLASLMTNSSSSSRGNNNNNNSNTNNNRDDSNKHGSNNPLWKGNNVPHIKTYFQLSTNSSSRGGGSGSGGKKGMSDDKDKEVEDSSMLWFCLGSHNLSKAALGDEIQSKVHGGPRFFVRHWELGVFVAPSMLNAQTMIPFTPTKDKSTASTAATATATTEDSVVTIPLPYRARALPYSHSDKPWAVDQRYVRLDIFGRRSAADA